MKMIRSAALSVLILASTLAYGEPPAASLADASVKAKETYDAARKELMERGKKAKAAAVAGDYAAWKPANEAYMQQIASMTGICEQNVVALTSASDVREHATKVVVSAYSQYLDVGSSMFKARLQLLAFANLAARFSGADRVSILKALAPQYLAAD